MPDLDLTDDDFSRFLAPKIDRSGTGEDAPLQPADYSRSNFDPEVQKLGDYAVIELAAEEKRLAESQPTQPSPDPNFDKESKIGYLTKPRQFKPHALPLV